MGKMSRNKGKRGELELRNFINGWGYEAKRGQQFCGLNGNADVVGVPGLHIECKRTEKCKPYEFLEQAERDCPDGSVPAVFHRRNGKDWMVIMDAREFMDLWHFAQTNGYV